MEMTNGNTVELAVRLERLIELVGCKKEILDICEASAFTGMSKSTLYKMCSTKTIPYYKSMGGKKIYFRRNELEEWMLFIRVDSNREVEDKARSFA